MAKLRSQHRAAFRVGVAALSCGLIAPASTAQPDSFTCPSYLAAGTIAGSGTTAALTAGTPVSFTNQWSSSDPSTFHHRITGPVGGTRITLETCSSASGGETVAVYPATAAGARAPRRPRVVFAIANRRGNTRHATATIQPSRAGARSGTLHLAVVVENASRRHNRGAYRLTVSR